MSNPFGDAKYQAQVLLAECAARGPSATSLVLDVLQPEHFEVDVHRAIWATLTEQVRRSLPASMAVLVKLHEQLHPQGDLMYLSTLPQVLPTAPIRDLPALAEIIIAAYQHREKLAAIQELARGAETNDEDIERAALARLMQSRDRAARSVTAAEATTQAIDRLQASVEARTSGETLAGVSLPLGFPTWEKVAPVAGRELTFLGARPSAGKSALVGQIIREVAEAGHGVGLFSLEMPADQWMTRLLSSGSTPIPATAIRDGSISREQYSQVLDEADRLAKLPIVIYDRMQITMDEIDLFTLAMQHRLPSLRLVVVDHVLLIRRDRGESTIDALGRFCMRLKKLAREREIAVIALTQLNRDVERRPNHQPTMADLYGASMIEFSADSVMILHQPSAYDDSRPKDEAELWGVKIRHGRKGTKIPLWWNAGNIEFQERAP